VSGGAAGEGCVALSVLEVIVLEAVGTAAYIAWTPTAGRV
jgi:hypothetical protein